MTQLRHTTTNGPPSASRARIGLRKLPAAYVGAVLAFALGLAGCDSQYMPGGFEDPPDVVVMSAPVRRFYLVQHRVRELRNLADHHATERRDRDLRATTLMQIITSAGTFASGILAIFGATRRRRILQAAGSRTKQRAKEDAVRGAEASGGRTETDRRTETDGRTESSPGEATVRPPETEPEVASLGQTYGAIIAAALAFLASMFQVYTANSGKPDGLVNYAAQLGAALETADAYGSALSTNPRDQPAAIAGTQVLQHAVNEVRDDIIREVGLDEVRRCEAAAEAEARATLGSVVSGGDIEAAFAPPPGQAE